MVQCTLFRRGLSNLYIEVPSHQTIWINDQVLNEAWSSFCKSALRNQSLYRRCPHTRSYVSASTSAHLFRQRSIAAKIESASTARANRASRAVHWTQCRHGSSVPGPLQGMRRTSLFRRMMNVSRSRLPDQSIDVDTFLGIDLSKSPESPAVPWQGDTEILTWSNWWAPPPPPPDSPDLSPSLIEQCRDDVRYADELIDNIAHHLRDSFYEIRRQARQQDQAEIVTSLLALISTLSESDRTIIVDKIGKWVEREIFLGRFEEQQIASLLAADRVDESAPISQHGIPWMICISVAKGIKTSPIIRLSNMTENTIFLLLRAIIRDPKGDYGVQLAKEILMTLGETDRTKASQLLFKYTRLLLNDRQTAIPVTLSVHKPAFRYNILSELIKDFPPGMRSETVARVISTLVHELRRYEGKELDERREQLTMWLSALGRHGLLKSARQDERWESMWQKTERQLSRMDSVVLANYLRPFTDREACAFIVDYLVCAWHVPRLVPVARSQGPQAQMQDLDKLIAKAFRLDLASDDFQYLRLLLSMDAVCPLLTSRLLRILYPMLFELKRPDVVWTISRYCYAGNLLATKPSLELLFTEVARWTTTDPTFALRLLLLDKRPAAGLCPSIPQALERAQDCPTDVLLKLINQFIRTYGVRHRSHRKDWTRTRYPITRYSSTLLHVMASRIVSQTDLKSSLVWRRVRRLFSLFRDTPDHLKKEMTIALTKAGMVRTLKEGRKIPEGRIQWIGRWICELEGKEVWNNTEAQARNWWRNIELQEAQSQRVWRPGQGWMPRKLEADGEFPRPLIRRVARRRSKVQKL